MLNLSVVILNWNALEDTVACLQSLLQWKRVKPTIFVVDNASINNEAGRIAAQFSAVDVIASPHNLGFSGGNNLGLKKALATSNAPVMLLNNDAQIAEADVITLLETLQSDSNIAFVGPLLYQTDRPDTLLAAGGKDPSTGHNVHNKTLPPNQPVFPVEYVPGTVIIGRAEVFAKTGLLDETYFFSSEVADLCLRAGQLGYQNVIDSRVKAYHSVQRSANHRSALYPYYTIRNRFLLIRKFHARWKLFYYAFWSLYCAALFIKVSLNGRADLATAVKLALIDGLKGRFGNQNERVLQLTASKTAQPAPGVS